MMNMMKLLEEKRRRRITDEAGGAQRRRKALKRDQTLDAPAGASPPPELWRRKRATFALSVKRRQKNADLKINRRRLCCSPFPINTHRQISTPSQLLSAGRGDSSWKSRLQDLQGPSRILGRLKLDGNADVVLLICC